MKLIHLFRFIASVSLIFATVPAIAEKPAIEDILATKVTFKADSESFESTLHALAAKVRTDHPDFKIEINGDDLKFEGMTRNMRIRILSLKEKTVAEVLTTIVLKANPNTLVESPSNPQLKLVWVVSASENQSGLPPILITTRDAATRRGDKLPKVFGKK